MKVKPEVLQIPTKGSESTTSDTKPIILYNDTQITFTPAFTYLGSIIPSCLSDTKDVTNRLSKANSVFGSL